MKYYWFPDNNIKMFWKAQAWLQTVASDYSHKSLIYLSLKEVMDNFMTLIHKTEVLVFGPEHISNSVFLHYGQMIINPKSFALGWLSNTRSKSFILIPNNNQGAVAFRGLGIPLWIYLHRPLLAHNQTNHAEWYR